MELSTNLGMIALALFAHFGGFMYWAGRVTRTLESHNERLENLEDWKERNPKGGTFHE